MIGRRSGVLTPRRSHRLGLVVTLALAALSLPAASAFADELVFVKDWGHTGNQNLRLFYPGGVDLDSSGDVFVADGGHSRIMVYDAQGNFLRKWGGYGNELGQIGTTGGLAIDPSDNVYVADLNNDRIQVFDTQGNFIRWWGGTGSGNGQFNQPTSVGIAPSGNVVVQDSGNDRIQVFDAVGNFVRAWGSRGTAAGQFAWGEGFPGEMAVDSSGNVFAGDGLNGRVQVFDPLGNFLRQWGSTGNGPGQFQLAAIVGEVDPAGNVFVSTERFPGRGEQGRIEQFDSQGDLIREWGGIFRAQDVAADDFGNLYVTNEGKGLDTGGLHRVSKYRLVPGPDTAVRNPNVSAKKKQPQKSNSIKVKVKSGSAEQVTTKATGNVVVAAGDASVSGTKTYKLKKQVKRSDPGGTGVLKLKPKTKGAKKIAKALKQGKKAKAKLKVKLIDDAGNTKAKKLSVKLKR